MSAPDPRFEIVGETWVPDPRERMARAVAQLIDKPLTVALVVLAYGAAAKGPGMLFPGYEPTNLVIAGLWLSLAILARAFVVALAGAWRRAHGIAAPAASAARPDPDIDARQARSGQ